MVPDRGSCSRGLLSRGNDRGPIFHAKTSSGKIVAQVRYASRLLASWRGKTIWAGFYSGFMRVEEKNVIGITGIYEKNNYHNRKIDGLSIERSSTGLPAASAFT
jgi:hypothetical protein